MIATKRSSSGSAGDGKLLVGRTRDRLTWAIPGTRPTVSEGRSQAALHGRVSYPRSSERGRANRLSSICPHSHHKSPATLAQSSDRFTHHLIISRSGEGH